MGVIAEWVGLAELAEADREAARVPKSNYSLHDIAYIGTNPPAPLTSVTPLPGILTDDARFALNS